MGEDFHMGAESCQRSSVQNVAPLHPKCKILQTMESHWSISNTLQYQAKQDLISISKKISNDVHVIWMFLCDKEIAIP